MLHKKYRCLAIRQLRTELYSRVFWKSTMLCLCSMDFMPAPSFETATDLKANFSAAFLLRYGFQKACGILQFRPG